ncbi:MAG: deoxyribose-phosphate aldolase [Bacteroidales bacterium]|nr:deoxyribose-phosphate aldolase [Bacteroidales bacterium]
MLRLLSCVDNTTLSALDSERSVEEFCRRTADMALLGGMPVAAVCVYPRFVPVAKKALSGCGVNVATVAGAFPHGQLPLELKIGEVKWCVEAGADEVDVVINRGLIVDGCFEEARREVAAMKSACGDRLLKVILECGELPSPTLLRRAAMAAMEGGADFIKTSTGKMAVGATHEAAAVMLNCIKDYVKINKRTVGFKAAGGIKDVEDAKKYAEQAVEIMGNDFFNNQTFRIGTSSLTATLSSLLTN